MAAAPDMTVNITQNISASLADGRVLVVRGGAEIFDPATDTWSVTGSPRGSANSTATLTRLDDGRMLLVKYSSSNPAEIYDPATGTWSDTGAGTGVSRSYHTASLLPGGKVMVMGGFVDAARSATTEIYDPDSNTWSAGPTLTQALLTSNSVVLQDGRIMVLGGRTSVVQIIDEIPILTTSGYTSDEGAVAVLTGFASTDLDDTAGNLTYSVNSGPANGTLSSSSFTQAELAAGDITYTHDGSETTTDSIDFEVTDPFGLTDTATLTLTINSGE